MTDLSNSNALLDIVMVDKEVVSARIFLSLSLSPFL